MTDSADIIDIEEAHLSEDEVLYTFQSNYRPVTVLVQSKSASNLREGTVNPSLGVITTTEFRERVSSEGRREMWINSNSEIFMPLQFTSMDLHQYVPSRVHYYELLVPSTN